MKLKLADKLLHNRLCETFSSWNGWLDRSGNFKPLLQGESHHDAAASMGSSVKSLNAAGWARVVTAFETLYADFGDTANQLTPSQRRTLVRMAEDGSFDKIVTDGYNGHRVVWVRDDLSEAAGSIDMQARAKAMRQRVRNSPHRSLHQWKINRAVRMTPLQQAKEIIKSQEFGYSLLAMSRGFKFRGEAWYSDWLITPEEAIFELQAAARPLTRETTLYRGGHLYRKGFISTSEDRDVAEEFDRKRLYTLICEPGVHTLYLGGAEKEHLIVPPYHVVKTNTRNTYRFLL